MLVPPLTAAGINQSAGKSVTSTLESVAAALEPFASMSTDQLAALLRDAEEYRRTGILPQVYSGKKVASPRAKAPKAPKLTPSEAVAKLRDLQDRSLNLEPGQIAAEVKGLASLTQKELQEVQKEFLGVVVGKKKDELVAALQKKLDDSRASRERVQGILAY